MKKRNSRSAIVCLLFFIFFFLFQINMFKLFKSKMAISPSYSDVLFRSSENLIKSFKAGILDPFPLQSPEKSPSPITCNRSSPMYDLCTIAGPTFLDPNTSTFYPLDPDPSSSKEHIVEKIKPYPRKWENFPMTTVKELTISSSGPPGPKCQVQHNVPAIVFSASGYTGNFYHEFNDGFIPLFTTVNSVFPDNQDFIMVISDANEWWQNKYSEMLQAFSKHPIINLHSDTPTHCFTSATLGLISHGSMTIDPTQMPSPKTLADFRAFLDRVYSHGPNNPRNPHKQKPKMRPRLVLVSRTGNVGRVVLNQNEVQQMAEEIGFKVILFEPSPTTELYKSYELINSSHAMVGVHGAALTHSIFLRPGAVFMQVVPLGLEKIGETCYASSARAIGLEYMEYEIGMEESSLTVKYGKNSSVVKDPDGLQGGKWTASIMNIYLKEQNVQLDSIRFREFLKKAYEKSKKFMKKEISEWDVAHDNKRQGRKIRRFFF